MSPPRILIVHNRYQQQGGEDTVVAAEERLLTDAGYPVDTLFITNHAINSTAMQMQTALFTPYNPVSRRLMRQRLRANRPDIVHVHNFFPRLSPSIFDACRDEAVPVVMTLHNYRLACANGLLFRDNAPCELCIAGSAAAAVRHSCYRHSRFGSAAVAAMIEYHRRAGTWRHKVSRFIALTAFARDRLVAGGLPADRMRIKPNFVADPGPLGGARGDAPPYALFVGRLSVEKGVDVLLQAWQGIDMTLRIVGDGPQRDQLALRASPPVRFLGQLDHEAVRREMAGASFLIVPSIWYEGFPMTVVEAMALGTPIIAAAIGGLRELLSDGVEGRHFQAGDSADLRRVIGELIAKPGLLPAMGQAARARYLTQLSPKRNLAILSEIYCEMVAERRQI